MTIIDVAGVVLYCIVVVVVVATSATAAVQNVS